MGIIVEACVELVGRRSRRLCSVNPGSAREIAGCRIAEVDAQEQRARAVAFAALADCCVRASWRCLAWGSQCMRIRKLESVVKVALGFVGCIGQTAVGERQR